MLYEAPEVFMEPDRTLELAQSRNTIESPVRKSEVVNVDALSIRGNVRRRWVD